MKWLWCPYLVAVALLGATMAHADPQKFTLGVNIEPEAVQKDQSAKVRVTITPASGYVLKVETPFQAKLGGSSGVVLQKTEFSAKDFEDPNASAKSVTTAFKANTPGSASIEADLTFFICNDTLCERFKAKPTVTFAVK